MIKTHHLVSAILLLAFSGSLFAKTINIPYAGKAITQDVELAKGDIVMINTTVPIGTRVMTSVSPVGQVNDKEFTFTSSMENAPSDRSGAFLDQMYTGANPGWVSYTYTGMNDVKATFKLNP